MKLSLIALCSNIQVYAESNLTSGMLIELNEDTFAQVLHSDKPVIVDFFATWCKSCKLLTPLLVELAQENPHFFFTTINGDECAQLLERYNVRAVPTLLIFKNGELWASLKGLRPSKKILLEEINALLAQRTAPINAQIIQENLLQALITGNADLLKKGLESGVNLDQDIEYLGHACSPLLIAVLSQAKELIPLLKENGALLSQESIDLIENRIENITFLKTQLEKLIEQSNMIVQNEITQTETGSDVDIFSLLDDNVRLQEVLSTGINVNIIRKIEQQEFTPLLYALVTENMPACNMLISAGASLEIQVMCDDGQKRSGKDLVTIMVNHIHNALIGIQNCLQLALCLFSS